VSCTGFLFIQLLYGTYPRLRDLFVSPTVDASPICSIQSRLFTELVRDSLEEYAYDAELAGLSYTLEQSGDGILLTSDGYNDKMFVLLEALMKRMKEYKVDVKRFANAVDQVRSTFIRSLKNTL
jgi:insulysin